MLKKSWHETDFLLLVHCVGYKYCSYRNNLSGYFKHNKLFLDISCMACFMHVCNVLNMLWSHSVSVLSLIFLLHGSSFYMVDAYNQVGGFCNLYTYIKRFCSVLPAEKVILHSHSKKE
jgi:hypothetical protein